jgi:hypothetical protein
MSTQVIFLESDKKGTPFPNRRLASDSIENDIYTSQQQGLNNLHSNATVGIGI